ncbi:MAG: hypothetical protein CM1200mP2_58400 [Planctomycetaceae bacterium]|nr:MAG: hypothetical protein CM1200mP2_58400 [Planctomycetaceae bacterium]
MKCCGKQDGQEVGRQPIALEAGQSKRLVYSLQTSGVSRLTARIVSDGFDGLSSDNTAYLKLPVSRSLLVWCDTDLQSYRHALQVFPDVTVYPNDKASGQPDVYDLAITETTKKANPNLEASVRLVIGAIPEDLAQLVTTRSGNSPVVDWNRSSLCFNTSTWAASRLPMSRSGAMTCWTRTFGKPATKFWPPAGRAPWCWLATPRVARPSTCCSTPTARRCPTESGSPCSSRTPSTSLGMPLASQKSEASQPGCWPPVCLIATRPTPSQPLTRQHRHSAPDPTDCSPAYLPPGLAFIVSVKMAARWLVSGPGVLDAGESSLASADLIEPRDEELRVSASTTQIDTDRPLWPTLAWIAFIVLLVEWWYFQRKTIRVSG